MEEYKGGKAEKKQRVEEESLIVRGDRLQRK